MNNQKDKRRNQKEEKERSSQVNNQLSNVTVSELNVMGGWGRRWIITNLRIVRTLAKKKTPDEEEEEEEEEASLIIDETIWFNWIQFDFICDWLIEIFFCLV